MAVSWWPNLSGSTLNRAIVRSLAWLHSQPRLSSWNWQNHSLWTSKSGGLWPLGNPWKYDIWSYNKWQLSVGLQLTIFHQKARRRPSESVFRSLDSSLPRKCGSVLKKKRKIAIENVCLWYTQISALLAPGSSRGNLYSLVLVGVRPSIAAAFFPKENRKCHHKPARFLITYREPINASPRKRKSGSAKEGKKILLADLLAPLLGFCARHTICWRCEHFLSTHTCSNPRLWWWFGLMVPYIECKKISLALTMKRWIIPSPIEERASFLHCVQPIWIWEKLIAFFQFLEFPVLSWESRN